MRLSTSLRLNAQKGLVTPYDPALTLDLQFAARQAYVANIGPLPTFTNATTTARTFVGSDGLIQTAAINVPRIDFDPVTRLCRGLLIEEQRTNVLVRSEEFSNSNWGKTLSSITANVATAPDGASTADKLVEDTSTNVHTVGQLFSTVSGTTYTFSLFIKAAERTFAAIALLTGFPTTALIVNLSTGASTAGLGTPLTPKVEAFPNGWYRVSFSVVATSTTASASASCYIMSGFTWADRLYTGDGTSGILIWGAQGEAGAFATSYIPTTTGSLVRSADVCSITGAAFTGFYNQTEGTLVAKAVLAYFVTASGQTYVAASDGSSSNRTLLRNRLGSEQFINVNAGVIDVNASSSGVAANVPMGIAGRYKLNDFAFSVSGGAATTDVSGVPPASVNQLAIGNEIGGSQLNGWIQSVQYYNTIKTNAQLQALSTP